MSDIQTKNDSSLGALIESNRITKDMIGLAGRALAKQVEEGHINPIEALVKTKALMGAAKYAIDRIERLAIEDAENYSKADRVVAGAEFSVRNGSAVYDYSHDTKWGELKQAEVDIIAQRKQREEMLRSMDEPMVDPETGEVIEPAKIVKYNKSSLAVSFPQE